VVASCLGLLVGWSWSGLGFWPLLLCLLSAGSLLVAGGIWSMLLVRAGAERRRLARLFLVAPVVVAVTAALMYANVPTTARFRLTQGSFDEAVRHNGDFAGSRLGSYRINESRRIDDGTFFFDRDGSLFDYAGFAYLPTGPSPSMNSGGLESPEFHHLYGRWWTFWTSF
jgi:hypothetical protein